MCWHLHSGLYQISAPLWTLIDSFVWVDIVHGISFYISRWYYCMWCILYTNEVIKGNTMCISPGSFVVACSPILPVSFKEKGCEPVICSSYSWWGCENNKYLCWQNYTIYFEGKLMYVRHTTDRLGASVRYPIGALVLFIVYGFFNMVDLHLCDALSRWRCSWRVLLVQHVMSIPKCRIGQSKSCKLVIIYWLIYTQVAC